MIGPYLEYVLFLVHFNMNVSGDKGEKVTRPTEVSSSSGRPYVALMRSALWDKVL